MIAMVVQVHLGLLIGIFILRSSKLQIKRHSRRDWTQSEPEIKGFRFEENSVWTTMSKIGIMCALGLISLRGTKLLSFIVKVQKYWTIYFEKNSNDVEYQYECDLFEWPRPFSHVYSTNIWPLLTFSSYLGISRSLRSRCIAFGFKKLLESL